MAEFHDKVALVVGGASGIGRATALRFAQRGAKVVVGDNSKEGAEKTALLIRESGGEAIARTADVTNSSDVDALVAAAVSEFGGLDFAANVAGLPQKGGGLFGSDEVWHQVISVNLTGTFFCSRAEAAAMKLRGGGVIVNVSSANGIVSSADMPFYDAAKHGVIGFTKSISLELAKSNIRVNALCPGFTVTPMTLSAFGENAEELGRAGTPLGRTCQPEEQAGVIVWLCSNEAAFMTGSIVTVDGGLTAGRMAQS